tara:strand:- start:193 stop:336 length:144 start_codon:yes stop_codon:yes gene_type:complete
VIILASSIRRIEMVNNISNIRRLESKSGKAEVKLKKYQEKKYGVIFK